MLAIFSESLLKSLSGNSRVLNIFLSEFSLVFLVFLDDTVLLGWHVKLHSFEVTNHVRFKETRLGPLFLKH